MPGSAGATECFDCLDGADSDTESASPNAEERFAKALSSMGSGGGCAVPRPLAGSAGRTAITVVCGCILRGDASTGGDGDDGGNGLIVVAASANTAEGSGGDGRVGTASASLKLNTASMTVSTPHQNATPASKPRKKNSNR